METKKQLRKDLTELREQFLKLKQEFDRAQWEHINPPKFRFGDEVEVSVPKVEEFYDCGHYFTKITGYDKYVGTVISNGETLRYEDRAQWNLYHRDYLVLCNEQKTTHSFPEEQLSPKKA